MFAIETQNLSKKFDTHVAVNNLNLQVPSGSICGFLGKNGAGKTTTIKMLVGLSRPSSGKIIIHGQERNYGKLDNRDIGYLPDVPNFYNYYSAGEYLDFCGKLYGMKKTERKNRIYELLDMVGLKDDKTPVTGYSRGMKQRLGIAQALMNSPRIIFLDEPISALDPIGRREIMQLIQSLRGSVTVFFSTHIFADDLSMLHQMVPVLLYQSKVSLEHYQIYTPSLEDIFMEVTSNE